MAKRAAKAPAAPKKRASKPKANASTDLGKMTEELFAAAYASLGSKSAAAAATAIGVSADYGKILLGRKSVKELIAAHVAWQVQHLQANGLRLVSEAWMLARSDISEAVERRNNRLYIKDDAAVETYTNKAIRKIVCKIEEKVERQTPREIEDGDEPSVIIKTEIAVEMHDKVGAMNLLAKHLGVDKPKAGPGEGEGKKTWLDFMRMCIEDGAD